MCLTLPGEVTAVEGDQAVVRTEGRLRRASTLALPDVSVGDRVIVAAGSIVSRLDPEEAEDVERLVLTAYGMEGAPE
jgi:hydrogenase assembly chaperone HypC/HupF